MPLNYNQMIYDRVNESSLGSEGVKIKINVNLENATEE